MDALYAVKCGRCGTFRNEVEHSISFSAEALQKGLEDIFSGFNVKEEIQGDIFRETLRLFNKAAAIGLSQTKHPEDLTDAFLEKVRHNNEVFSAFRTHREQNDIASFLVDDKGQLRSFGDFAAAVKPITDKYGGRWLRTEYDTAITRAHRAADWKHFEAEKDIYPRLKWMPTTSAYPDPLHATFWQQGLTLAVGDPFWDAHHPGDRWGCKCSLESTMDPENDEAITNGPAYENAKGLNGNPGKTGKIFSEDHPYYPKGCGSCPFSKGLYNRLEILFKNERRDCEACKACSKVLKEVKNPSYQKNAELCKQYSNDPEYRDVAFNKKSGGMKATHIEHNFDKIGGKYELDAQSAGFLSGHSVILTSEKWGKKYQRFTEGLWDGKYFEVAGRETATCSNIFRGLKHCAAKRDTQIAVLDFPNGNFNVQVFNEALNRYKGLEKLNDGQFLRFEKIVCVQNKEIINEVEL